MRTPARVSPTRSPERWSAPAERHMNDPMHCGDCMIKCDPGFSCVRGSCVCGSAAATCMSGQQCCSGTCGSCTVTVDMGTTANTDGGSTTSLPPCDCTGLVAMPVPF